MDTSILQLTTKRCRKCLKIKPFSEFYRAKIKDGVVLYRSRCKECTNKEYRDKHPFVEKINKPSDNNSPDGMVFCSTCKEYKKLEEFCKYILDRSGKYRQCRNCQRVLRRKNKYNLAKKDYDILFSEQNGCCAICRQSLVNSIDKSRARLDVDHDHRTGHVRGLLCRACNVCLGYMKDSIENLESAIRYLKKYS